MLKKQKTEQQPIERENAQNTHSKKTLIDEVELVRFLKGGLAAK
jgi:sulfur carrier protein ThiS